MKFKMEKRAGVTDIDPEIKQADPHFPNQLPVQMASIGATARVKLYPHNTTVMNG